MGQLFEELAVPYTAQLRDVMLELRWGRALTEWIAACEPVVHSLRSMAEKVGRDDLLAPLDALASEMSAASSSGARIEDAARDALLRAYQPLIDAIPKAFALDEERNRREPIIIRSTLLQIEGVEKLTIDKLQAAGAMTIDALTGAAPGELAETAGISASLAERIRDRFREEGDAGLLSVAAPKRSDEIRRLASHVAALEDEHRRYEKASQGWSREAKAQKRKARAERTRALLRIHVSLARLGEIERIVGLDRLPFDKKIEALAGYLRNEEARQKHG